MTIKINKQTLIICLFILAFLPPQCLSSMDGMQNLMSLFALGRYMFTFGGIVYILLRKRYRKYTFNAYTVCFFAAILLQIVALKKNGSIYMTAALSCISYIGFTVCNIIFYYKNKDKLLYLYRNILMAYIVLHFMTLLMFSNGLVPGLYGDGRVYFLGGKNALATYILFAVLAQFLYRKPNFYYKKDRREMLVLNILLLIIAVVNNSATTTAAMIIVNIYIITICIAAINRNLEQIMQRLFVILALIIVVGFFYLVVIQNAGNNSFMGILTSILGREITFSGRRKIWDAAINYIMQSPVWGVGFDVQYNVWGNNRFVYSAHNMFLDYAVKYGCLSLIICVMSIIVMIYKAIQSKKNKHSEFALIIGIALIFAAMFEAIEGNYSTWACMLFIYLNSVTDQGLIKEGRR